MSRAIMLIGHGSLSKASGASMIRLAASLRERGLANITTAGFLNFSRPTFQEAIERCLQKGATEIIVQPYFLIDGYYVNTALRKLVDDTAKDHPDCSFLMTQPFGDHPALAELVIKRIPATSALKDTAIVLMAHGTPKPESNAPIYQIAKRVEKKIEHPVKVAFMECNEPTVSQAIDTLIANGHMTIIAVPYFLQLGGHVREDLPNIIRQAQLRHTRARIDLTEHLSFDETLLDVIETRVNEVQA